MDFEATAYTRVEYERRFLVHVDADWRRHVESYSKTFEDLYIRGTRLRLRRLTDSDTGRRLLKLTKKHESASPYFQTIGRLLLSPGEYELFDRLDGDRLGKVRHYCHHGGRVFSVDAFEGPLDGLVMCETEAASLDELMAVEFPPFAAREVTEELFFTGGNLCRASREELLARLAGAA